MDIFQKNETINRTEVNRTSLGLILLFAILVASFLLYWPGIVSLLAAWNRAEYSHGYIIPIIAFVIAVKRYGLPPESKGFPSSKIGITTVVIAILLGMLGRISGIADIVTYGMLLSIAGLAILFLGLKSSIPLWPAWVYLAFMLPLPNFIYWPLSIKLQFLSSQIGVFFIKLLGVPVFLEGNIIDLGTYQLQVAEACSGLRYLFPLMSFGFLFAVLYRGANWQKCLIFLSTIPITIFMNSARIGIIGFLVDRYGIKQAEGFLHVFEGWVIFALCILLLFLLAITLQWITGKRKPVSEVLDLSLHGLGHRLKRLSNVRYSNSLVLVLSLFILAFFISTTLLSRVSIHPQRSNFDQFPMELAGWTGKRAYLDFEMERVLGADDYIQVDFKDPSGAANVPVNFLVSYYQSQTEGSGIHSPEVCIPAGGWEVSKWEQTSLRLLALKGSDLVVNRAIIQKEKERQLVYYWFEQRGRRTTNDYVAKVYTVWDSVMRGRSDGALIRVITSINENNNIQVAEERLNRFLELAMNKIPDFVPP
jgi:exosortase D (VPLPA-CTERM-specific)